MKAIKINGKDSSYALVGSLFVYNTNTKEVLKPFTQGRTERVCLWMNGVRCVRSFNKLVKCNGDV